MGDAAGVARVPDHRMLGIRVHALTDQELLGQIIARAIEVGEKVVIGHQNMHSVYLCGRDAKMRAFYDRARFVYIDGMGIILLGRLLGVPLRREHRITFIDWLDPLCREAAARAWRILVLGGPPASSARTAEILSGRYPGLQIRTEHGYFDATPGSTDTEALLSRLAAFGPKLLLVGMGMPRQEHWILDNVDRVGANVIINVGAFMELVTGALPLPPRWIGRLGLEWLFRLATQPRRTWRRYLVEPWPVAVRFAAEWLQQRRTGHRRARPL